jgi:DNA-binding transcriptional regulator GbsR (MarR family)
MRSGRAEYRRSDFVEQLGLLAEQSGMPRMAGRVLGWLLICDTPRQSFGDLVDALQASKGSISTMTRLLVHLGLIERVSTPGDRRDFFELTPDAWTRLLRQRVAMIARFGDLAERGLPLLRHEAPRRRERLQDMVELYTWWERESTAMLERWEARHPPRGNSRGATREEGTSGTPAGAARRRRRDTGEGAAAGGRGVARGPRGGIRSV